MGMRGKELDSPLSPVEETVGIEVGAFDVIGADVGLPLPSRTELVVPITSKRRLGLKTSNCDCRDPLAMDSWVNVEYWATILEMSSSSVINKRKDA